MYFVDHSFMESWLALVFIVAVPFQVAVATYMPSSVMANLPQPFKGGLMAVSYSLLAMIFSWILYLAFNGELALPSPLLINYVIVSVVVTFWFVIVWQCCPVNQLTQNTLLQAVTIIVVAFTLAYVIFNLAFDFSWLSDTAFYVAEFDPKGWFNSWQVVAFLVTTVAVIFSLVLLDFYPISRFISMDNVFTWGLTNSVVILSVAGAIYYLAVHYLALDPVIYLVNGPISYIFGIFIPLNLMQGQLFNHLAQPVRGFCLMIVSAVAGLLLNQLYFWLAVNIMPSQLLTVPYQQELCL
jgi:hypothetical protein